jgi:hypothetical protein
VRDTLASLAGIMSNYRCGEGGEVVQVSPASAYKLIVDLVQLGILEEIIGGKRGRQYMFMAYLNLFK